MSRSARWTLFTLLGLVVWLGATVAVAATNDDPSDATPILRTFAMCGGGFIALALLGAAWEIRHSRRGGSERLYRQLALTEPSTAAIRTAARRTSGRAAVYLGYVGVTTALLFLAIGFGEAGPYRELFLAMLVLVVIWLGYAIVARGQAYATTDALLAPLGLAVSQVPSYVPNRLVGELAFTGERHGRAVSVRQTPRLAITQIGGSYRPRSLTGPTALAAMTGEPVGAWRGVEARAGTDGVVVRRTGNGAGCWLLHDLLLAERLAGPATGFTTQPGHPFPDAPPVPAG